MARLVDKALQFVWPLARICNILRQYFRLTMVKVGESDASNKAEENVWNSQTNPLPDISYQVIFNIEPDAEPEKPLQIDLNIDQLEDFND